MSIKNNNSLNLMKHNKQILNLVKADNKLHVKCLRFLK